MQQEFKYLIFKDASLETHAVLFPKKLSHKAVARTHSATFGPRLISAGFCSWRPQERKWAVHGSSESLGGMAARPEDAEILLHSFPLHQE